MEKNISQAERSRIMAAVKSRNTKPEIAVRNLIRQLGYRLRPHVKSLPGTPDIALPALRTVIEVRGCFWHGHSCGNCRIPATNRPYWTKKISRNTARDHHNTRKLRKLGWSVLTVWECQTKDLPRLKCRLRRALQKRSHIS